MKKILLIIGMMFSFSAFAGIYPVVVSLVPDTDQGVPSLVATIKEIEIGPAADVVPPAGMYVAWTKVIIGGHHRSTAESGALTDGVHNLSYFGDKAWYDFNSKTPDSTFTNAIEPDTICAGFALVPFVGTIAPNEAYFPAGCSEAPPVDLQCLINTPQITLDHGVLSKEQASGSVAKASIDIKCTGAASVSFTLTTGNDYIHLSPTGKAEIKVDNKPLNSKIDLPSGLSVLEVSDVLSGVTAEGVNTASGVLIINPY
ncbi:hypothetical protein QQF21_11165 [Lelliottia sp. V89_10]|uniref:hypothetical protein n=1 Tax=Lelliottia wanjuensis TaxID=3050585 RepID=UPI00249E958A|nr:MULTISPECIES: hypothetical protein [unclassified Lelliottia]MDI3360353.1 hypothetical protein [Lelliottia sp. V89_13]MDK9549421.1 hypothetical protein [Lelliottia sp. V89_5]MDK9596164.1 hypothetical protein [Lelliottia sp. V89_10]